MGVYLQEFATAVEQLPHRVYPALPQDHIKWEQVICRRGRRHSHKNPTTSGRTENGKRGFQAGPRAAGRPPSSQAPKTSSGTYGGAGRTNRSKRPKTIGLMEPWRARPLQRQLLQRKGGENDDRSWKHDEKPPRDAQKLPGKSE